jgi:hypothetical protein
MRARCARAGCVQALGCVAMGMGIRVGIHLRIHKGACIAPLTAIITASTRWVCTMAAHKMRILLTVRGAACLPPMIQAITQAALVISVGALILGLPIGPARLSAQGPGSMRPRMG